MHAMKLIYHCLHWKFLQVHLSMIIIMIYNNKIYKSEIKNHVPIEHIGGGDAYIGGLINGILKCNSNILDDADNFAIECQNSRGNFI